MGVPSLLPCAGADWPDFRKWVEKRELYLGDDVGQFRVESVFHISGNGSLFSPDLTDHGEQHWPDAYGHQNVEKS